MKPRLVILLLLMVGLPLGLLAAAGFVLGREEQAIQEHRTREFLRGLLIEVDGSISRLLEDRRREMAKVTDSPTLDPERLRDIARETPLVSAMFVMGREGQLLYPADAFGVTARERDFLERSRPVWQLGIFSNPSQGPYNDGGKQVSAGQQQLNAGEQMPNSSMSTEALIQQAANVITKQSPQMANPSQADSGWYAWYWGNGTHLLYWRRTSEGMIVGAEMDRARLMSDVIGALPASGQARDRQMAGRIVLRDANGEALYQWGEHETRKGENPAATLGMSAPLQAWRLDYYVPGTMLTAGGKALWFNMLAGLMACGIALALAAFYFYREHSREMREASQRVNFVNQVSHELKTPLTNIRMYAELMEGKIEENADPKAREYLEVISSESQRLSRLIGNVLTFGRSRRNGLSLHAKECRLDEVVKVVVEHFRPALERKRLKIEMGLNAGEAAMIDSDAVEQILGNLLSNVEKYSGEGGAVTVESRREGQELVVVVGDDGSGIPERERDKIFRPFYRVRNELSEGVSGTGIGLAIARELARLHRGDLILLESERGAIFEMRIREIEQ